MHIVRGLWTAARPTTRNVGVSADAGRHGRRISGRFSRPTAQPVSGQPGCTRGAVYRPRAADHVPGGIPQRVSERWGHSDGQAAGPGGMALRRSRCGAQRCFSGSGTRHHWLDPDAPAEVVRTNRHAPPGLLVHSYTLAPQDVCTIDGMRVTTPARTAFDLGRLLPHTEAIPILDALMNKTGLSPEHVWRLADANSGIRGVDRLRTALADADGGAQSPLETRTRLLLWNTGVPGLRTHIVLRPMGFGVHHSRDGLAETEGGRRM